MYLNDKNLLKFFLILCWRQQFLSKIWSKFEVWRTFRSYSNFHFCDVIKMVRVFLNFSRNKQFVPSAWAGLWCTHTPRLSPKNKKISWKKYMLNKLLGSTALYGRRVKCTIQILFYDFLNNKNTRVCSTSIPG